jgi:hypothetical protein
MRQDTVSVRDEKFIFFPKGLTSVSIKSRNPTRLAVEKHTNAM